ncbi:MAG TPA: MOSC domain-containing protein [Blastocatellia bacterium]|nr:MOSC domain-containing protein [Blastocatellia bacterium]
MRIVSVNVGLPRDMSWKDQVARSGIFKEPVAGPVAIRTLNLAGDEQADLTVHGGVEKAVYAYPAEHYEYWRREMHDIAMGWGMFGENLTTEGMSEPEVNVGDRFRVGSAELRVTGPRLPCYKLGMKFRRDDIIRRFLASGRTGFYFAVTTEGSAEAGDVIELISRDKGGVSVSEVTHLYTDKQASLESVRRVAEAESLPESWRDYFRRRLESHDSGQSGSAV